MGWLSKRLLGFCTLVVSCLLLCFHCQCVLPIIFTGIIDLQFQRNVRFLISLDSDHSFINYLKEKLRKMPGGSQTSPFHLIDPFITAGNEAIFL